MKFDIQFNRRSPIKLANWLTVVSLFTFGLLILSHNETWAADQCSSIFATSKVKAESQSNFSGPKFLHEKDSKLHMSSFVEKIASQYKRVHGQALTKPPEKIQVWLTYLDKLSIKASNSKWAQTQMSEVLYKQFVIKEANIPESHYNLQVRMARERGHGDIVLTKEQKAELARTVIVDQKHSLNYWSDFMISKDTEQYPMWLKYWMFTGAMKLSKYDGQTGTFGTRSAETTAIFPEVNREALAYMADIIVRKLNKASLEDIQSPDLLSQLEGMNFGKIYGQVLFKLGVGKEGSFATNEGKWINFPKGSDHMILVKALEGRNTGWCTAAEETAKYQIGKGDFNIYFSLDANGKPTIPRAAIRMNDSEIGEIRGVGPGQNMDIQMNSTTIVSDKVKEFGKSGDAFLLKDTNMRVLTTIENKHKLNQPLTADEIRFLYEIDRPILGFGVKDGQDPRIHSIRQERSLIYDYNTMLNSTHTFTGNITLPAHVNSAGIRFPKEFNGNLKIDSTSIDEITLPVHLKGDLILNHIREAKTLVLPKEVLGSVSLADLIKVHDMTLPEVMTGKIDLSRLYKAHSIKLPNELKGDVRLDILNEVQELALPKIMEGGFYAPQLPSHNGMIFPKKMKGDIDLRNITSGENLILPEVMVGDLLLSKVSALNGLLLPMSIKGELSLSKLESPVGLVLPKTVSKGIELYALKSAEGLKFPDVIPNGGIGLNSLTTAVGLQLPQKLGGSLFISNLVSPEGLKLPLEMKGRLYLSKLSTAKDLVMPKGQIRYDGPADIGK
jgi:hypothetical protein